MPSHDDVMAAINGNDPVIRPMQLWRIPPGGNRRERRLRILAKHPEPDPNTERTGAGAVQWIYREEPVGRQLVETVLSWIPEFNLRMLFELHEDPLTPRDDSFEWALSLPYTVMFESAPGESAVTIDFKTAADIDHMARDFFSTLKVLEGIGHFNSGIAGEEATNHLKRIGVWSERVERIGG